jgi:hypothetical protein
MNCSSNSDENSNRGYVSTPEYQKLLTTIIDSLRLECRNTMQQYPDADAVMERICEEFPAIAFLERCDQALGGDSHK